MGVKENVGYDRFPIQGSQLHSRVSVCFDYNDNKRIEGTVIRDDAEEPGLMLIRLDDGRVITSTECQYQPSFKPVEQFVYRAIRL